MGLLDGLKKVLVGDAPKPEEKPSKSTTADTGAQPAPVSAPSDGKYKAVKVEKGGTGWGGPLIIQPIEGKHLIYSVTGGGIHPVAQKIADLTGGTPFDGFKSKADFSEIAVAVIDCGGTARVGVYPMKNVLTVDVHATTPAGPLMKFIKETNFVSGVSPEQVTLVE